MINENIIKELEDIDNKKIYHKLLELEDISNKSDELYKYINYFLTLLNNNKTYIRVRGFRLICKQSKWDKDNIINKNIDKLLFQLDDEKPTSVRQYLRYLEEIIVNKKELNLKIKNKLNKLDYSKYKDTMQPLIKKDINKLLTMINSK